MNTTGIVRSIDDLGRLHVPKELRKILNIRSGDPLEFYVIEDGFIGLRRHLPFGKRQALADQVCTAASKSTGLILFITDTSAIISGSGHDELNGVVISEDLNRIIFHGKPHRPTGTHPLMLTDDGRFEVGFIAPIHTEKTMIGCIAALNPPNHQIGDCEIKVVAAFAEFMSYNW